MTRRAIRLVGLLTALLVAGSLALPQVAGATTKPAGPPGNNGTVKIDREPFDDHPDNQPHVGCTFQVDFYGYDKGDLHASVTFEAWEPTLRPGDDQVLLKEENIFIGEDDNSGGGSEAGLDASRTYTLDLSGITPQRNQGVHVKLTVHADGSRGADTKYKVFWVQGCESAGGTTTTTTTTLPPPGGGGSATTTTTTVLGGGGNRPTPPPGQGGALPFTGANSVPLAAAGLLLLLVGAGAVLASRRMRTR